MKDDGARGRIDFLKTYGWSFVPIEPKEPKPKPKPKGVQYFRYRGLEILKPTIKTGDDIDDSQRPYVIRRFSA